MPKVKLDRKKAVVIPYVSGFKPPTARSRLAAGKRESTKGEKLSLSSALWSPLPHCTSEDDWLAQYAEPGQSLNQFVASCPWLSRRCKVKGLEDTFVKGGTNLTTKYPKGCIYVLPLGDFPPESSPDFDALVEYAKLFFCYNVKKLPTAKLEFHNEDVYWIQEEIQLDGSIQMVRKEHLSSRYDADSGERQLRVDTGLLCFKTLMPDDGVCMMVLTMSDLYAEVTDLFVAGIAQLKYRMGIFSLHRYNPNLSFSSELWFEKETTADYSPAEQRKLTLQRSCRLLVHETMHLLGFNHCIYYSCCMNGSGHLKEDFSQPMYLCPVDHSKLEVLFGFKPLIRYEGLRNFYQMHAMEKEADWMERRIRNETQTSAKETSSS